MPWYFSFAEFGPDAINSLLKKAPFCSLPATLSNYEVAFKGKSRKWGGALATLEGKKGNTVFGALHLVTPDELALITRYHRENYQAKQVNVNVSVTHDKFPAVTFMYAKEDVDGFPSEDYVKEIIRNLKFFWGQDDGKTPALEDFGIMIEYKAKKQPKVKNNGNK